VAVLSEENNHILRGIRRASRWASVFKIIYWLAIIAISYGAYVYIQPYVEQILKAFGGLKGMADTVQRTTGQFPR